MFFRLLYVRYERVIFLIIILFCSLSLAAQKENRSVTNRDTLYIGSEFSKKKSEKTVQPTFSSASNLQVQKQYSIRGTISLNITTISTTCNYNNGSIIIKASGGTSPYTYTVSNAWTQNNGNFANLGAGNYVVTVTDASGQSASANVTLANTISAPVITIPSYQLSSHCLAADASVTLNATGGLPPYQYSLDLVNFQSGNTFSNLFAGEYEFFVQDANGCVASKSSFAVNSLETRACNSSGFSYSATACGSDGGINALAYGLDTPYQYSIDGIHYSLNSDFENLPPGVYPIYMKGASGNLAIVFAIDMPRSCFIRIKYISVDAACGQSDGTLTVNASDGASPYTYSIDGLNFQPGNTFTGLSAGLYTVTAKDNNGVLASSTTVVYDRCPTISLTATEESCAHNDATITATGNKGTTPYQYSIDGIHFQSGNTFTALTAGSYTITLKDANNFTSTATITVNNICLPVTASATNSTCGNTNGKITASASGGSGPYQYSIDGTNFQSSNIFSGLAAGTYTIIAKDFNGHTGTTTVAISNVAGPQIFTALTPASCKNNDGSFTITPNGGTSPFQYSLDGNTYQTANVFNKLPSGSYTAWIKDANGCTASAAVAILLDCPVITATTKFETCHDKNGSITANAGRGTAPYQYSLDGSNFQNSGVFTGLAANSYIVFVKDALGIASTDTVSVSNVCPTVSLTTTKGLCGSANASVTATGANGTIPYQYSIDGIHYQSSNIFSSLPDGSYTITVKDGNGLTNKASATVQNFPGPAMTLTSEMASCLNNNGSISVSASGGTSPLLYSINGASYQSSNLFTGLSSGNYILSVKDSNGCIASQATMVYISKNIVLDISPAATICEGKSAVLATVSNADNYVWSPASGLDNIGLQSPTASPTNTTIYHLTASLGVCTAEDSVLVTVNAAPVPATNSDTTICYGQSAQLLGSGGINYRWTPSTYLNDANSSAPVVEKPEHSVSYSLNVVDTNGCASLQSATVIITVTPPAMVFAGRDTSIVINQPFQLHALDVNNSGFVQYTWSPTYGLNNASVQNPVVITDKDITYSVMASTAAGCEGGAEINIKVYRGPEIYVPNAFTPNGDGHNDVLKAIPVGIIQFKRFVIYDRWGQQVFYTSNAGVGWDGNINGTAHTTSVYVWIAEGVDDKGNTIVRKGTVVLIR